MLREPTLHVLAEAAEVGLVDATAVHLRPFDPLLRPFIGRRVRRALSAASTRTTSSNGEHVLRLAFLSSHPKRQAELDANDEPAVAAAFSTLAPPYLGKAPALVSVAPRGAYRSPAPERVDTTASALEDVRDRPRHPWPITRLACALAALVTLATVALLVVPSLIPTPFARFRKTPTGQALGGPLTSYISARGDALTAREALVSRAVKKQLGADILTALTKVLDDVPVVATAQVDDQTDFDTAIAPLFADINALDAQLAATKTPAHLHAYVSRPNEGPLTVWVTSYFVESREEVTIERTVLPIARGRRIDNLNLVDTTVSKGSLENWAIASLERIEEEIVRSYLGPMARDGMPGVLDPTLPSPVATLKQRFEEKVARELLRATKVPAIDASGLLRAIDARKDITASLIRGGYDIPESPGFDASERLLERVKRTFDTRHYQATLLDDYVRVNSTATSYRKALAPVTALLARMDADVLAGMVLAAKPNQPSARTSAAASLAVLARETDCPHFALWRLAEPLFSNPKNRYRAFTVLDALFVELKLALPSRKEDPDALIRGLGRTLELPAEELRAAAAATYTKLFAEEVPAIAHRSLP